MFFKSKNPEPVKEDSRIQDLKIITQMNQDLATTLDLNETLQNALEVIIKRINAQAANVFLIEEKKQVFQCIASKYQAYLDEYENRPETAYYQATFKLSEKNSSIKWQLPGYVHVKGYRYSPFIKFIKNVFSLLIRESSI